jgi:hypothetical protein
MTITFESDKDVIVYAFEKIISYARQHQYIVLAQSVWWISSIIGLQTELVIFIDNLKVRRDIGNPEVGEVSSEPPTLTAVHPSRVAQIYTSDGDYIQSNSESISTTETDIHNKVIDNCEIFLGKSKQEREAIGRFTRQASGVVKLRARKPIKSYGTQTAGIEGSELRRRKAARECHRCAWPQGRKNSHKTIDCKREIKFKKGTAKEYNKEIGSRAVQSTYT